MTTKDDFFKNRESVFMAIPDSDFDKIEWVKADSFPSRPLCSIFFVASRK